MPGRKNEAADRNIFADYGAKIFQAPRLTGKQPRPRGFCRPGGAAKNLPPQRANRRAHAPVFVGGVPRTPSRLSLRPKAGSVARPPALKAFSHFFAWPEWTTEKIGEKRRLKGGGRA
ncbi:hypothetical protein Dda3937_04650 [Dickeya dadantii 3937]|uniref:Uncharacterized protein n=1 Tax=Dickeya dadantii (strain 3937) TaxID=198628 RepID=E0SJJ1_DICD3|nr:hypothetical protein Dda3937_04650 [Dickeya dadantii 3937]